MADDPSFGSRRELENLRQRYQEHRRTIRHLLQTAPDERLATRYEATLTELQKSIDQLDRIDRDSPADRGTAPSGPDEPVSVLPAAPAGFDTLAAKPKRSFEDAELATENRTWNDPVVKDETTGGEGPGPANGRGGGAVGWIAGIIILIAIVLAIVFFWPDSGRSADEMVSATETAEESQIEEAPLPPAVLDVQPSTWDYGVIKKGTRSVHRFTVRNRTDQVLPLAVGRSECRCLWYDHDPQIPAGGSIELAITVDGARADAGILTQTVVLTSSEDPDARAEIDLTAEISPQ